MKQRNLLLLMILIGVMVCFPSYLLADIGLPVTGQTACYDSAGAVIPCAGTEQDGDLQAGVVWTSGSRFFAPDQATAPAPGDGALWDSLTGLMWYQLGNTGGNSDWGVGLDRIHVLNTNTCQIGGAGCAAASAELGDVICRGIGPATNYCNSHWRMPSHRELESIFNYGWNEEDCGGGPGSCTSNADWLNNEGFTAFIADYYWAATFYGMAANSPLSLDMVSGHFWEHNGNSDGGDTTTPDRRATAVRGEAIWDATNDGAVEVWASGHTVCFKRTGGAVVNPCDNVDGRGYLQDAWFELPANQPPGPVSVPIGDPAVRFINNYNGTITDTFSGLMWTQSGQVHKDENPGQAHLTFDEAVAWVAGMNAGSHINFGYYPDGVCPLCTGWRMPNRKEMFSLQAVNSWTPLPYLISGGFVIPGGGGPFWWTSTSVPSDPTRGYADSYWHIQGTYPKTTQRYLHPVREASDPPFGLGVAIDPPLAGTVVSLAPNAGDINCPPDCSQPYLAGNPAVELQATAFLGSIVDPLNPWTNCDDEVTSPPNCIMDVSSSTKGVQANFVVPPIIFDPLTLNFGNVPVGQTIDRTIRVYNYDVAPFEINNIVYPGAPFTVLGSSTCDPTGPTFIPVASTGLFTFKPTTNDTSGTHRTQFSNGYCTNPTSRGCNSGNQCTGNPGVCTAMAYPSLPVNPGMATLNFQLRGWGWQAVQDDGSGNFVHFNLNAGTIDYATGLVMTRMKQAPQTGSTVNMDYAYNGVPSCTLDVRFAPVATGDFVDSVLTQGLKPVGLWGTGTAPAGPAPKMLLSQDYVSLMSTSQGATKTDTVTVTNIGGANLVITDITDVSGRFSRDYVTDCSALPITLTPASSCDISVSYTSLTTVFGPFFDSFMITSNDSGSPTPVGMGGSTMNAGTNSPPTKPKLTFPVNGAFASVNPAFKFVPGEDFDVCISDNNPVNCDPLQRLSNIIYLASDPAFANLIMPMYAEIDRGISYAMVFGNPVFLIALFGIVAAGVFLRRKKIAFIIVTVVFVSGLLLTACGGKGGTGEQRVPDIGGSGGGGGTVTLEAGTPYWWKVIACDGAGGCTESEIWSFIAQ